GDPNKFTRKLFEKWVPHHYPTLYVQYKGRGTEWFGAELPFMFDWMNHKKRSVPVTQLGRYGDRDLGDLFATMRAGDNRFYWISSDTIDPRHINAVPGWNPARLAATLSAH